MPAGPDKAEVMAFRRFLQNHQTRKGCSCGVLATRDEDGRIVANPNPDCDCPCHEPGYAVGRPSPAASEGLEMTLISTIDWDDLRRTNEEGDYGRMAHYFDALVEVAEAARQFVNTPNAEPRLADPQWAALLVAIHELEGSRVR